MKIFEKTRLILGLVPAIAVSCNSRQGEKTQTDKPNVILVLVDDMGYGDLSCFGQEKYCTPALDRMASEGIRFNNFYCGSTVSAPSRASLLTGMHTGHTSVRGNAPEQVMGDNEMTLAKVMKAAGYTTGCIGKWGIGHPPPADDPKRKGFDHFYGYINMMHAHNLYPEFLYRNGEKVLLNNKLMIIDGKNPWENSPEGTGVAEIKNEYVHDLFDQEAKSFIEKNKDNKFFLYLAYNVPHANNEKNPDGMEVPDYYEFAGKDWPSQEKGFAAMMRNIDKSMEMIFSKLKELKIDNRTLVIFCSDNGPHQEGGHQAEYFNSNGKYRGIKRDLYEGGIRTPFIVRWPGVIKAGSSSEHVAAFWDVLPTFCELTDVEKPDDTDGISFLNSILGKEQTDRHEYLYWEFYEQGGKQAILKDNWKAMRLNVRGDTDKIIFELYDLSVDPGETLNIAHKNPSIIEEFNKLFEDARKEFSVTPLYKQDNNTVETPF
ncbi:MAG: arylsulfatase [Bacteroidales bacterium]|nr:arylsulfatase [Bacteroidales bacterium]